MKYLAYNSNTDILSIHQDLTKEELEMLMQTLIEIPYCQDIAIKALVERKLVRLNNSI